MLSTTAISNYQPAGWSYINYDSTAHILVPIDKYCSEYSSNASKVTGGFNTNIMSITRVQNPFLYGQFLLKQEEYRSRGINFAIKELFHDTAQGKIDSIVQDNFDWRLTNRDKFGKGVSFSPSPAYANKQSSRLNGTYRAMIITDVLVGQVEAGYQGMSLPSSGDTTMGNNYNVYVKFYNDEFYPKYVVNYESAPQVYGRRRNYF